MLVVPDDNSAVRSLSVARRLPHHVLTSAVVVLLASIALVAHGLHLHRIAADNARLRNENRRMREVLDALRAEMPRVDSAMERSVWADQALRSNVLASSQPRMLSIGPTEELPMVRALSGLGHRELRDTDALTLAHEVEVLGERARRCSSNQAELQAYFSAQRVRLSATPSIWPARGVVSSSFGGIL